MTTNKNILFVKYIEAVRQHFPAWLDPDESEISIREQFESKYEEIKNDLSSIKRREQGWAEVLVNDEEVCAVFSHLLNKYSFNVLSCNAWWALHTAQERGLLDYDFLPILDALPIDCEAESRSQVLKKVESSPEATKNLLEFWSCIDKQNEYLRAKLANTDTGKTGNAIANAANPSRYIQ